jgi:hypothetical protein
MILHIYKEVIRSTRNSNRATQTIKTELSIPEMSACPSVKRHDDIRFQLFGNATTITETQVVPTITIDDVYCHFVNFFAVRIIMFAHSTTPK